MYGNQKFDEGNIIVFDTEKDELIEFDGIRSSTNKTNSIYYLKKDRYAVVKNQVFDLVKGIPLKDKEKQELIQVTTNLNLNIIQDEISELA